MDDDIMQWAAPFRPPSAAELADRLAVSQLVKIYALGIDMRNYALCRSAFADGAHIEGTVSSGDVDDYLPKTYAGAAAFMATQHNITNQHVTLEGDEALVWSYAITVHKAEPGSGTQNVTLGVQYRDRCRRTARGWLIASRKVAFQWSEKS